MRLSRHHFPMIDLGGSFTPGSDAPTFSGIESGAITERPTPSTGGLYFNGVVTVWNNGVKATLASGDSAAAPADPTNFRIDVLLDNNTWISGASNATETSVSWPAITAGRTWLCAVLRRTTNVIQELEDSTSSPIIATNHTTCQWFRRKSLRTTSQGSATPAYVPGSYLPILLTASARLAIHAAWRTDVAGVKSQALRAYFDNAVLDTGGSTHLSVVNHQPNAGTTSFACGSNWTKDAIAGTHNLRIMQEGNDATNATFYMTYIEAKLQK